MPQSRKPKLPASLEALVKSAQSHLANFDQMRADLYFNQMVNGHGDDEIIPDGEGLTYAENLQRIDDGQRRLLDGCPPVVIDQLVIPNEDPHRASVD